MEKLILLGHSNGGVPILIDQAFETFGIKDFLVVKNLDLPDISYPKGSLQVVHVNELDISLEAIKGYPVQFGVHNCPAKNIIYRHFLTRYGLDSSSYLSLIHSQAYVAPSAVLGAGAFLEPMVVISSLAELGFGVTIKRSASIGHHSKIGDFVCINPGAVLSGFVEVGEGTVIGSGAVISNNVKIGRRCLIGAGSVVTKDIPDGMIAFGSPCKPVRENDAWNGL